MKFTKEAKIGLIAIISLFILYFGINYLKGVNLFKPTNHYYVKFDNVAELQKSAPIYIEGFKVGIVNDILYDYSNANKIVVLISLDKSMKITSGSYVEKTTGFTTGASLHIVMNKYVSTNIQVGDTIDGSSKAGMMDIVADDLMPKVQDLLPKIDSILTGLASIVNHPALTMSLDHIERTGYNLEKSSQQLSIMMSSDIPLIMTDFRKISSDFSLISANMREIDLNQTVDKLNASLENVQNMSEKFGSSDNNVGLLLNDRLLYDNLTATTENAANLLLDFKQNPKRYVHFSIFNRNSNK
ncbi:mammalian cell entry protein [Bacteroidales bacterium]|nr:mammalian cell entry protein [Bacteroidales bacterium]